MLRLYGGEVIISKKMTVNGPSYLDAGKIIVKNAAELKFNSKVFKGSKYSQSSSGSIINANLGILICYFLVKYMHI